MRRISRISIRTQARASPRTLETPNDHPDHHITCAAAGSPVRPGRSSTRRDASRLRRRDRRRPRSDDAEQDRLPRPLRTPEGRTARGLARDRSPALHAGAQLAREGDRRVRHLVRHLDPAPWPRACATMAAAASSPASSSRPRRHGRGKTSGRRADRSRRNPRGRCAEDAEQGPARSRSISCCSTAPRRSTRRSSIWSKTI